MDHGRATDWSQLPLMLTVDEIAQKVLPIDHQAVYRLIREGKLVGVKPSQNRVLVPKASLIAYCTNE